MLWRRSSVPLGFLRKQLNSPSHRYASSQRNSGGGALVPIVSGALLVGGVSYAYSTIPAFKDICNEKLKDVPLIGTLFRKQLLKELEAEEKELRKELKENMKIMDGLEKELVKGQKEFVKAKKELRKMEDEMVNEGKDIVEEEVKEVDSVVETLHKSVKTEESNDSTDQKDAAKCEAAFNKIVKENAPEVLAIVSDLLKVVRHCTSASEEARDLARSFMVSGKRPTLLDSSLKTRDSIYEDAAKAITKSQDAILDQLHEITELRKKYPTLTGTKYNSRLAEVQAALADKFNRLNTETYEMCLALTDSDAFNSVATFLSTTKEVKSDLRDLDLPTKMPSGDLSKEEANEQLLIAVSKLNTLKEMIEKCDTGIVSVLEEALAHQKRKLADAEDVHSSAAVALNEARMRLDFENVLAAVRTDANAEVKAALREQAERHADHMQDLLLLQEQKTRSKCEILSDERSIYERKFYQKALDQLTVQLEGIEEAVDRRASVEATGRRAMALWLAIKFLHEAVYETSTDTIPGTTLKACLERLRKAAACGPPEEGINYVDPYVSALLDSVDRDAISDGITTKESLQAQFPRLAAKCHRSLKCSLPSAKGDPENPSYWARLWSSVAWLLHATPQPFHSDEQIQADTTVSRSQLESDVETLHRLIETARFEVEQRGDIEFGARLLSALPGFAGEQASPWLQQALRLAEMRQLVNALGIYASAKGIGTLDFLTASNGDDGGQHPSSKPSNPVNGEDSSFSSTTNTPSSTAPVSNPSV